MPNTVKPVTSRKTAPAMAQSWLRRKLRAKARKLAQARSLKKDA